MHTFLRGFLFIVLITLLSGCMLPLAASPASASQALTDSTPELYVVPPDATPTPTPFRPLAPTAVYLPTATPIPTPTPDFQLPAGVDISQIPQPKGQVNILLLGSDQRPWDPIFRTDTMILATINPSNATVNLTSFPRDLWVNIPGYGSSRLNVAYGQGGFPLLADTFEVNFGVHPDYYVLINFESFKKAVDGLGGLDVEVSHPLADYRSGYWVDIPAGTIHMDADDVLWYVRSRKTSNDFARSRRQQEVLQAIFERALSADMLRRVPELYDMYRQNVTTDLTMNDILPLLPVAAKMRDRSNLHHYFIGPEQTYDFITWDGAMVLMPLPDRIAEVMRQALNSP